MCNVLHAFGCKVSTLPFLQHYESVVRKVCSHFDYLEIRLYVLGVIWQPVRKDFYSASVNSHSSVGLVSRQ